MKKFIYLQVFLFLIVLALSGCSNKQLPMKAYTLYVKSSEVVQSKQYRSKTLKVAYARSIKESVSYKMKYSYSETEQGFYQNSQWSNNIGRLLQSVLIDSLERSRMFKAVLPYTSSLREDYRLESHLFDFSHHIRDKKSYASVSIQFNLIDIGTGKLIKSRRFNYTQPTRTVDAQGYAEATNIIISRLSSNLLRWL